MKLTTKQIEENTKVLSVTQSGRVLMTSSIISDNQKDYQEGRIIEVMLTFEGRDPYFVYYLNEDYYYETANSFGLGLGSSLPSEAEENRNNISQFLGNILIMFLYAQFKINLNAIPYRYSHNYTNTNTMIFVQSLDDWYPIRHAMNEPENAPDVKVNRVNIGKSKITDYISVYDLSPRNI